MTTYEPFENDIQLVIARYNEDLEWINDTPYNKYRSVIYNKSDNSDFTTSNKTEKVVNLKNVGREGHTYLYHIIENYNNLATITVFLPGSLNLEHKNVKSKKMLDEIEANQQNVFIGTKHNNVKDELYEFQIDNYKSNDVNNSKLNPSLDLDAAEIRPFGKWYDDKFPDAKIEYISYYGVVSATKNEIRQHPKLYYENLIKDLENSPNPEAGHYVERSWAAIFGPMHETQFIEGFRK